jgi:hypothetical protein
VIAEDASDALNFNDLVISGEGATCYHLNSKKVTNVNLFTFSFYFLNIFELVVTKKLFLTFAGRNFPHTLGE